MADRVSPSLRLAVQRTLGGAFLAAVGICLVAAAPVNAATCAGSEVSARGEPASYRWLAAIKARGNWRSKVRALPGLGPSYANYGIAADPTERCVSNTGSVVCTVTATPCKP
jgi:hypothetical protein